jgi:iron complex transport system ATP-binding protein
MSLENLFEAHQVDLYRDQYQVFKDLNLTIKKKESVAILGANGSGKTTLLKAINREIYPASKPNSWLKIYGKVNWDVWQLRSMIGNVSDDLHLAYNPQTIGMEVILSGFYSSIGVHGLMQYKITDHQLKKTQDIMRLLNLMDLMRKPLSKMSMGQQRRCLLGRALVNNPQTLLLDEPTTGLDLASTFKYLKLLNNLKKKGHNIILVTHNLHEISDDIDRVILLNKGKIIADGPKEEIITEENLSKTYEIDVGLSIIQGKYLPYAKT